jgi:glycosyltransferase involved in cell wall biosynthesis
MNLPGNQVLLRDHQGMKVLFMLPYSLALAPGQRYRVEQWLKPIQAAGVTCDVVPLMTPQEQNLLYSQVSAVRKAGVVGASLARAIRHVPRPGQYDAIWIYRSILVAGPPVVERLLVRTGTPIIYDFDDAIWMTDTMDGNRRWGFLKCAGKTAKLCGMAAAVVTGNDLLAEYARRYNGNVCVVPSTVDTDTYLPRRTYSDRAPVVIGWSGSPSTVQHLRTVTGALRRVVASACVELRVMGGEFEAPGIPLSLRLWSPEREVEELQAFDIGIMPLPDDPWSRGKCGMKALLYMGVGVPVVASPVGVNTSIIQDGQNGFLADSEDEWVEKLLVLVRSVSLRRSFGTAGRATVEATYSLRTQAPRVLRVLQSVL